MQIYYYIKIKSGKTGAKEASQQQAKANGKIIKLKKRQQH